jgi:hypothetical protein
MPTTQTNAPVNAKTARGLAAVLEKPDAKVSACEGDQNIRRCI